MRAPDAVEMEILRPAKGAGLRMTTVLLLLRAPLILRGQVTRAGYDGHAAGAAVPGPRLTRITLSNSSLSAGFWKNAAAPAFKAFSSLFCGSRALSTITGTPERASLFCKRLS